MLKHLKPTLGTIAAGTLTLHVVVSALQNTPDSFNLDLRPYSGGWPLPGWRFFAPNPGIQNVHLLVRTRTAHDSADHDHLGKWTDVTPPINHSPVNVIWNPKSRGPKALFDAMQQLSAMKSNYASFQYITQSQPYALVADAAAKYVKSSKVCQIQFMLINYFPSEVGDKRIAPVLVSDWIPPLDKRCEQL